MKTKQGKDLSIETLRGIAIILVVMGHVIGSKEEGGMRVADDSFLRHLYFTFEYLRMPLFTVISGWVYALRPANLETLRSFNVKKVRRILIPLVFVGGSYYIIQAVIPGTNFSYNIADIWRILFFPYTFYWYLQSLFIVFVIISLIDAFKLANTFRSWFLLFIISIILLLIRDMYIPESFPNYFGFKGAMYLFPFFLIGVGIKNFKAQFNNKYFIYLTAFILLVSLIIQQLIWYDLVNLKLSSSGGLGLIIGVSGVIICLRIHFKIKWLVWMGNYAYTIFLFHSFGTSGGRIVLNAFGIYQTSLVFATSLILGLFVPIIIETILDRFGITRMMFLGRSFKKQAVKNIS